MSSTYTNNGPIYLTQAQYDALETKEIGREYCIIGSLEATDIPSLDASKITSGTFADARIASASTWNNKQNAITSSAKLSADLVDDSSATNKFVTASDKTTWSGKQDALATQTAYSAKGTSTKVPQITTNTLGQVTGITEVDITKTTLTDLGITATATELNTLDGITASTAELNYTDGVTSNIQAQLNNKEDADNTILKQADVINAVDSTSTIYPLSANMGKTLQTQISNLKSIGRFLAIWNATTGVPSSEPPAELLDSEGKYNYRTGDYYRVGVVGDRIPTGTSYTPGGTNWTTTTETLTVGDVYYFDGTVWARQASSGGGTVQDVQVDSTTVLSGGVANITLNDFGITATSTELNVLDGITATTQELNYVDGVTSAIQTQLDGKQDEIENLNYVALNTLVAKNEVVDNLTTTTTNVPLSANQGKVLKDLVDSKPSKATFDITGDGTTTQFTINHTLNTRDVIVQLYDLTTYDTIIADVTRSTTTSILIDFKDAPVSGKQYRVLVVSL